MSTITFKRALTESAKSPMAVTALVTTFGLARENGVPLRRRRARWMAVKGKNSAWNTPQRCGPLIPDFRSLAEAL